jgi:hypothetical protein
MLAKPWNDEQLIEFESLLSDESNECKWPVLDHRAYQGLAGEIVETIDPHTESDPVAILGHTLAAFGNIIGRSAHYRVEGDRHYTNENYVFAGDTAKGRKGTAEGVVNALFALNAHIFKDWKANCVKSGLSSGEGIIYHVRDGNDSDVGVTDKRLYVREPEFGGLLRTAERPGNTLSPLIRQAWDTGDLALLTKNNPLQATGAHISIIGHITSAELKKYLYDVEVFNGLANRFLWLCVKRSKLLPEGGCFHDIDKSALQAKIAESIEFARTIGEVKRDEEARRAWIKVYPHLSDERPGLAGAFLSRAEAHVMRLAMLYALMDVSSTIKVEHLSAALALWEYVEQSVNYLFGDRSGDEVKDRIVDAVTSSEDGLTRTDVFNLFNRHEKRQRITDGINELVRAGKVCIVKLETGGRPVEKVISSSVYAQKAHYAQ